MGIVTYPKIIQDLQTAFDSIESDSIVLHTDVGKIGIIDKIKSRKEMLSDYMTAILKTCENRALLFPTFNYDFCKNGVYSVKSDPCQVGVLNEHVRRCNPDNRTLTPIFNFCILNGQQYSLQPMENPFSASSTFGELVKYLSTVVFFGAEFQSNTFLHHVEEVANVGYRYIKNFPGVINTGNDQQYIVVKYRVRPLIEGSVVYDWPRLYSELVKNGILKRSPVGNGWLHNYRTDRLLDYWYSKLRKNEFYLLTSASKEQTLKLYKEYGKPLKYEVVEQQQYWEIN